MKTSRIFLLDALSKNYINEDINSQEVSPKNEAEQGPGTAHPHCSAFPARAAPSPGKTASENTPNLLT